MYHFNWFKHVSIATNGLSHISVFQSASGHFLGVKKASLFSFTNVKWLLICLSPSFTYGMWTRNEKEIVGHRETTSRSTNAYQTFANPPNVCNGKLSPENFEAAFPGLWRYCVTRFKVILLVSHAKTCSDIYPGCYLNSWR